VPGARIVRARALKADTTPIVGVLCREDLLLRRRTPQWSLVGVAISLFGPGGAHFHVPAARPERQCAQRRSRPAPERGPPKGGRRRLGLEGREHGGRLMRRGRGNVAVTAFRCLRNCTKPTTLGEVRARYCNRLPKLASPDLRFVAHTIVRANGFMVAYAARISRVEGGKPT
jgi:hypothetical protein